MLQHGALVNMFRAMVDNGGDIQAGILAYSGLVGAEKEKLSRDSYEKLLIVCNDDGVIILRLIKSLLEPFDGHCEDICGRTSRSGTARHRKHNSRGVVRTLCGQGMFGRILRNRRGRELLKYPQRRGRALEEAQPGCLSPIMQEMEYDIERHVKKFGSITEDTVMRMIFFLHVLTREE